MEKLKELQSYYNTKIEEMPQNIVLQIQSQSLLSKLGHGIDPRIENIAA